MLRLLAAVLLGYFAMALLVFTGLSLGYSALGADRAFMPDAYEVSLNWALLSVVVGFVAALAGGWITHRVAGDLRGPVLLAAFVGLLGLLVALTSLADRTEPATPRTGSPAMFEAMEQARTPAWLLLLNPLIGVVGVALGGGLLKRR